MPHNFKYITKPINNNINNIYFFFRARNFKIEIEIEKEKYHYESPTIVLSQKYGIVENLCKTRSKKPTKQIHNNLIPLQSLKPSHDQTRNHLRNINNSVTR